MGVLIVGGLICEWLGRPGWANERRRDRTNEMRRIGE
jgi:hypothetical protein